MTANRKTYTPMPGETINETANAVVALVKSEGKKVEFSFNDIDILVDDTMKPADVVQAYSDKSKAASEAYRNSSAARAAAAKQEKEVAETQQKIHAHVANLDPALKGGLKTLIPWLKDYALLADDSHVDRKHDHVLGKLVSAGYKESEYTGPDFIKGNKEVMGRYIVGQAIACMNGSGPFGKMPPHPAMTEKFADQYIAMPDKPAAAAKPPKP